MLISRIAEIYVRLGKLASARQCCEKALNLAYEIHDTRRIRQYWIVLSRIALMIGKLQEAERASLEASRTSTQEFHHQVALVRGIVCLHKRTQTASDQFRNSSAYCRAILTHTATLYEPQYTLATARVGQAVCNSKWADLTQRVDLLTPALAEYRRALDITSAPGAVRDAIRDLELIRAAGIEGLEPVFELLEGALDEQS